MVNLAAGKPFKSGCRNVVVVLDPDNTRIGIKAADNGVFDRARHVSTQWLND